MGIEVEAETNGQVNLQRVGISFGVLQTDLKVGMKIPSPFTLSILSVCVSVVTG